MRLLHIIDDLLLGGAERNLISVIPALREHEHRVVHLLDGDVHAETLRAAGAEVGQVPARTAAELPNAIRTLRRMARECDVVHTQRWRADLLGRLAAYGRAPIVTTVQTSPYEPSAIATYRPLGKALAGAVWAGDALLSRYAADRVVAVSEYVRKVVVTRLRVPAERTRVVYNAIPLSEFARPSAAERAATRAEIGLATDDLAVITVGHVVPLKGQARLVEALPRLPKRVRLVVVGEGEGRADVEARAAALGATDRVRLLGLRKDVPRLLGACDAFALASDLEGLPLSALEAMATGLACVLSPIGPHEEMAALVRAIDPMAADALLAHDQSSAAWASALGLLADDPALRERMGAAGRRVVERHFDAPVAARALEAVFQEARAARA